MARDRKKLDVFTLADEFAVTVYRETRIIARDDEDVRRQLRRAALSIPANIAEGCGRRTTTEYARFLDIALGSASEADYLLEFCERLELMPFGAVERCRACSVRVLSMLQKLHEAVRRLP